MKMIEKAIALALRAHRGQADKAGEAYILHPLRVMLRMNSELEMIAAVLHDVVEDSDVAVEHLRAEAFPAAAIEAIGCLTKRKGEDYETFINRAAANPIARKVKIADLEDNIDIARLAELGPHDLERLAKYHRALQRLKREL